MYESIPETLDDNIFFGLTLDDDQRLFRDALWDKEKTIVLCDAKAGTGKSVISVAVDGMRPLKRVAYDGT